MVRILFVVPYAQVREHFQNLIAQIEEQDILIDTMHLYGTPPPELVENCPYDIIISRGLTYRAFVKLLPNQFHIEIGITGFDVINAVNFAKQCYQPRRIAIFAVDALPDNIHQIAELCDIPIELYEIEDTCELEIALSRAHANGADVFIGGLTLCQQCDARGFSRVHIKSGTAAIELAIHQALQTARSMNQERAKAKMTQSMLNNSPYAIIAIDHNGNIIERNERARIDLKLPEHLGAAVCRVEGVLAGFTDWKACLESASERDTLYRLHERLYLISCKPVLLDGHTIGVMLILQNAQQISESESKIRKELAAKGLAAKYMFESIIGDSPSIRQHIAIAYKYSQVDSNVLITGETGTGKELFAHSIHNASQRSKEPFVAVNCAALPENLLESELFGYAEGAFSGAVKGGKAGLFELAHKGTIFLDEIGEMPLNLQAKLLRTLQEKEIRRVGDNRVLSIDVRVISATNIDIGKKIQQGHFRADLLYRLNLLEIRLPPLRERKEDIPVLVHHFAEKFSALHNRQPPVFTDEAMTKLCRYSWPGNARELRNVSERLIILNDSGLVTAGEINLISAYGETQQTEEELPSSAELELLKSLTQQRVRQEDLAKLLGVSRSTLWRKRNEYKNKEK